MTRTLAELEQLATDCMESNNPNVQERHRGAGACARAVESAEHASSRRYYRNHEAAAFLEALELEDDDAAPLTTAELLLTAAMIAARAEGAELPTAPAPEAAAMIAAGDELATILEHALLVHFYEDKEPEDCPEREALNDWEKAKATRAAELERVAWAVQWAGCFATQLGDCKPGGPAFSSIAEATAILERYGVHVLHDTATRRAINATRQLEHERHVAEAAAELTEAPRPAPIPPPEDEPEALFRNDYKCSSCGHEWQDEWSCACDDDCPKCGARHMTPIRSEELEPTSYDA